MEKQSKYLGVYQALIDQLDKLARHNRQGSIQTKHRYYEAMKRFCRYLAREYRLQKLANISDVLSQQWAAFVPHHAAVYILNLSGLARTSSVLPSALSRG